MRDIIWNSETLKAALGDSVMVPDGIRCGQVQFNSQDVQEQDLFIAIVGGARDGHQFVQDALNKGACAAIVSKNVDITGTMPLIVVKDTMEALSKLSVYKRRNSKAKIIAITGSVGKTSTKSALSQMMAVYGKTFFSRGNFNNYLGLPINLASMPDSAEYAVFELGMSAKGELRVLSKQLKPDIAIITTVAPAHLEFFNSIDEIADAKSEIMEGLDPETGVAVINCDMPSYQRVLGNVNRLAIQKIITFGRSQAADWRYCGQQPASDGRVKLQYGEFDVERAPIPDHFALNFAACFATISALSLPVTQSLKCVLQIEPEIGRGKMLYVGHNGLNHDIICDYYNSSPEALKASLAYFATLHHPHKVVIIGEMRELGVESGKLHASMVPSIIDSGAKDVFLVGKMTQYMYDGLPNGFRKKFYLTVEELLLDISGSEQLKQDSLILIKGSRGVRLEKVAEYLGVQDVL